MYMRNKTTITNAFAKKKLKHMIKQQAAKAINHQLKRKNIKGTMKNFLAHRTRYGDRSLKR